MKKKGKRPPETKLPEGILENDLLFPGWGHDTPHEDRIDYEAGDHGQLEMWYTEAFGWCIPTLKIGNAGRHDTRRTYAIAINTAAGCRIGHGPHVKRTVTVYIRKNRVEALQKFIDLYNKGLEMAGFTRDRISTRRMNTQNRRRDLWDF